MGRKDDERQAPNAPGYPFGSAHSGAVGVRRTKRGVVVCACALLLCALALTSHPGAPRARGAARQVAGADVNLTTEALPDTVPTGSNVTYTLKVSNDGSSAAAAVVVTDELPEETTFVSCVATGGGVCGGSGNVRTVTFDSLAPEASETITLVARVDCALPDGVEIDNTASVRHSSEEPGSDEDESETVFNLTSDQPPLITKEAARPAVIWPPSHKMHDVAIDYAVTDRCGPVTTQLSVTSNEPADAGGDGHTGPDWEVVNDRLVRLRAERSGSGNGRVYTVTITATDSAGQSSSRQVTVTVPQNQKK